MKLYSQEALFAGGAESELSSALGVALHAALLHSSEFGSFWL